MSKTLKIGIVGTGAVAGAHIDNWKQVPGAEVVAVCSRDKKRAQAKLDAHDCKGQAYDSLDAMLKNDEIDVVNLCTPHARHPEETIAAAKAGKHIVIEKPVALNADDLGRMVEAVEQAGVLTSVCFELHWMGSFKNTRALIERGDIGKPFYAEASYYHGLKSDNPQFSWGHHTVAQGGSAFLTAGCHALDGVIHMINDRVVEVTAYANTSETNPQGYEYPANVVAILRFASGAIGKTGVSVECECPYHFPVVIQGSKGTICDDRFYTTDIPAANGWITIPSDLPESGHVKDHPYKGQFQHLADCIASGEQPENNLTSAAHVHDVVFAIDASIEQGGQPVAVQSSAGAAAGA